MTLHSGDHASSFVIEMDTSAPQGTTNVASSHYLNILDWVTSPRKYSKGQNFSYHLKAVNRFLTNVKAPTEYHLAILVNSLDEECQLELFSHPEYNEDETDLGIVKGLLGRIFEDKEAKLSKLVRLLEIRQETTETLSQFLARIRVEAYKIMGDEDKIQKEKFILSSFVHGLREKSIGRAVRTMNPENSEEALRLAKRAETKSNTDILRIIEDKSPCMKSGITEKCNKCGKSDDMSEMKRQLQLLSQQVTYLTSRLKFQERQVNNVRQPNPQSYANAVKNGKNYYNMPSNFQASPGMNWNKRSQTMRCWNCNGEHTLRQCTKKIICKTCQMIGHVSRFCKAGDAVRYLHEEFKAKEMDIDQSSEIDSNSLRTAPSVESDEGLPLLTVELKDENRVKMSTERWQKQKQRQRKKMRNQNEGVEMNTWIKYIDGETSRMPLVPETGGNYDMCQRVMEGTKKRKYSPTIISTSRHEGAANKPLVLGKCGSVRVPILIDSGAALNVIDQAFVESLPSKSVVKMDYKESLIRCANDQTVRSRGRATLVVEIGSHTEEMVFSIMPNLFPRVIIGLKQMKHSKMVVDPPLDALWVGREKIDFISKTEALHKGNF